MIKIRYDAYICVGLFFLNACGSLLNNSNEGVVMAAPIYRIQKIQTDALPTFFHSGTFKISNKPIPLSSYSLIQEYREPFLSIVGTPQNFSVYNGNPESELLLEDRGATYVLRSVRAGKNVTALIVAPFESLFKCSANVPLCLHVSFSPLYTTDLTLEALDKLFLETSPLKIEFREIAPS